MLQDSVTTELPTVLVVEDDEEQAAKIGEHLVFAGYTVVTVDCVNHALARLHEMGDNVQAVVLDFDLSRSRHFPDGAYGKELLVAFKAMQPKEIGRERSMPWVIGYSSEENYNAALVGAGALVAFDKHLDIREECVRLIGQLNALTQR